MAYALARIAQISTAEQNLAITLQVIYVGPDVEGGAQGEVNLVIAGDAQPAAIRTLMSNGVAADAQSKGFTVTGANMTLPQLQKG